MKMTLDALIVGGGSAGMGAAMALKNEGVDNIMIAEREPAMGGILNQCIHNGFGLHRFREELTGPEYAERYLEMIKNADVPFLTETCVIDLRDDGDVRKATLLSAEKGLIQIETKTVILSMGCRERNRGNIAIPGDRPAGVMTAGLAQKMANLHGRLPGKEIVVLGSGDIGLIMARRMTWEGAKVKGVIEMQSYPGGLNRNIVQCLNDFDIPLHLSHIVTRINGKRRVESVDVAPINQHHEIQKDGLFNIPCDTLLLSVGLIPENELSLKAGVQLDPATHGAAVDHRLMTNIPGVFACGNVLHVHDLVDWVSEESERCGKMAANFLRGEETKRTIPVRAGSMARYVLPKKAVPGKSAILASRCLAPMRKARVVVKSQNGEVFSKKQRVLFPSIMVKTIVDPVPEDAEHLELSFVKD